MKFSWLSWFNRQNWFNRLLFASSGSKCGSSSSQLAQNEVPFYHLAKNELTQLAQSSQLAQNEVPLRLNRLAFFPRLARLAQDEV